MRLYESVGGNQQDIVEWDFNYLRSAPADDVDRSRFWD
jgi:hypothetical protein